MSDFRFVQKRKLRFDLSPQQTRTLRQRLPRGLYWIQPNGRNILWNEPLVTDYLVNGGDTPSHNRLVEKYLSTLPPTS